MSTHRVIAIDGTAASGKSTFARELAARLGFAFVSTGEMYRGVTWFLLERGMALDAPGPAAQLLGEVGVETRLEHGGLVFRIGGIDPLPHLRDPRVNAGVSHVAQIAAVRERLVAEQRRLAETASVVMEGRDIGTVVFPHTPFKFYLDADAEVRAQRRQAQGETDVIGQRDRIDSQRQVSPLICAADALRLDSGRASVAELIAQALRHLEARGFYERTAAAGSGSSTT
jgi:cytidylate kinase